jgi:hypothetical protein
MFHALSAVSQTARLAHCRGQIGAPSRAWPAPGGGGALQNAPSLRRDAPGPRLGTELAAPGANQRTMLGHGAVRLQAN